jgi:hypothetical protein
LAKKLLGQRLLRSWLWLRLWRSHCSPGISAEAIPVKSYYLFIIFGLFNFVSLYATFQTADDIVRCRIWLLLMGIAIVGFLLGALYVIHCDG